MTHSTVQPSKWGLLPPATCTLSSAHNSKKGNAKQPGQGGVCRAPAFPAIPRVAAHCCFAQRLSGPSPPADRGHSINRLVRKKKKLKNPKISVGNQRSRTSNMISACQLLYTVVAEEKGSHKCST